MALDYYRPYVSGLAVYVERLGNALAQRGHAITVLTHRHTSSLPEAQRTQAAALLATVVGQVPADWLGGEERRGDYIAYLRERAAGPRGFAAEAEEARGRT